MTFVRGGAPQRPVRTMSSGQVTRTLLLVTLIAMAVGALSYQLGAADTSFDRPGELVLLFVDIAPVLWFAAAPVILTALRFQALDARLRWIALVAVIAATVGVAVRLLALDDGLVAALIDPFTLGMPVWVGVAVLFIRARARRFARGTDEGITAIGMGLGFFAAAVGVALGGLRLVLVGPLAAPGVLIAPIDTLPTTTFLTAASLAMVAGIFWLVVRTRGPRTP